VGGSSKYKVNDATGLAILLLLFGQNSDSRYPQRLCDLKNMMISKGRGGVLNYGKGIIH